MKNKIILIIISLFYSSNLLSENISIESKIISIDKKNNISIFEDDVITTTSDNYKIKSQYGKYDKNLGMLEIKKDVKATDNKNNIIETEHAKYNEISKTLNTFGPTKITTTDNYIIESEDLSFDNLKRVINSNSQATIIDQDENKIYLENFEYLIEKNIFKSIGRVKIIDKNKNSYEFSQVYIDTKKKEILGTDSKLFINQQSLKINEKNKPRVFANTTKITENEKIFKKNIFTICDYRKDDKCPPWSIQSSEMLHDNKKLYFIKMQL